MSALLTVSAGQSRIIQKAQGAFAPTTGNGVAPSSGAGIADTIEGTSGRGRFLGPRGESGTTLPGPTKGSGVKLRKDC